MVQPLGLGGRMQELVLDVGFEVGRGHPDFNARHTHALHARKLLFVGGVGGANLNEENGLALGVQKNDIGPKQQGFIVRGLVEF